MIETVLDQAQKLFGRGYLVVAFIPSLLFTVVISSALLGFATLRTTILSWAQKEFKEVAFEALLILISIYLLAYVLYGIRAAIHQFYQGSWPFPLNYLLPFKTGLETWHMRQRQRILLEKEAALDVPFWVLEKDFEKAFTHPFVQRPTSLRRRISNRIRRWLLLPSLPPTPAEATALLQAARRDHNNFLTGLRQNRVWREKNYWRILTAVHFLQARISLYPQIEQELVRLVAEIKTAYEANLVLQTAVTHLSARVRRQWTAAYNNLHDNFPQNERWLRPTRLGNISSMLESYPRERYGINLSALWSRLIHVTTEDVRLRIEDANLYLDFTTMMSFLSAVAAVITGVAALYRPQLPPGTRFLVPLSLLLSTWLFYHLAIQATRSFGIQVQAAVDMFRLNLLDEMNIERPKNPEEEKQIWTELRYFIAQADLPTQHVRFKGAQEEEPPAPSAPPSLLQSIWQRLF